MWSAAFVYVILKSIRTLGKSIRCIFQRRYDEVFGVVNERIESQFNWTTHKAVGYHPADCDTDLDGTNTADIYLRADGLLQRCVWYGGKGYINNMDGWWGRTDESAYDMSTGKQVHHTNIRYK